MLVKCVCTYNSFVFSNYKHLDSENKIVFMRTFVFYVSFSVWDNLDLICFFLDKAKLNILCKGSLLNDVTHLGRRRLIIL